LGSNPNLGEPFSALSFLKKKRKKGRGQEKLKRNFFLEKVSSKNF